MNFLITLFAKINVEVSTISNNIDSRPSDAIALAVRTGAPIFVSEEVMGSASFIPSSEDTGEEGKDLADDLRATGESDLTETSKETQAASLQDQLRESIEKEDYERAAILRDKINKLKGTSN